MERGLSRMLPSAMTVAAGSPQSSHRSTSIYNDAGGHLPHHPNSNEVQRGLNEFNVPIDSSKAEVDKHYLNRRQRENLSPGSSQRDQRDEADHRKEQYLEKLALPPSSRFFDFLSHIYIVSLLIFFSIWGTLARLGVQWLTFYPGAPIVTSNLWANFGGCILMGLFTEDQRLFRDEWGTCKAHSSAGISQGEVVANESPDTKKALKRAHNNAKKSIPLFVGLTTGFCGSMTSFSTFSRDAFLALSNDLPTPMNHPYGTPPSVSDTVGRNGGYSLNAVLAVIIVTVAVSIAGLVVGAHLALAFEGIIPTLPSRFLRRVIDPLLAFLGMGCWLGAVLMAIWPHDRLKGPDHAGSWMDETWRGKAIFATVFAPVGCLLRYYLSLKLNPRVSSFPLGTFSANSLACATLGMCYDLQHVPLAPTSLVGGGLTTCQVLQGVEDGFCGCLSTVSTWVVELKTLSIRSAWLYGIISALVGVGLLVAIMGGVRWSIGFSPSVCIVSNAS